ncbi:Ctr-domain-containing protein [Lophium mytilinum]|uniref:Copper transport protein n=1 Tax=Lophium mytilinum TaxID=390894 RepID=A0A6A6RBQ4_9PEZI|nr:Ctr-domain-containing protein [Lophium mytilinum]
MDMGTSTMAMSMASATGTAAAATSTATMSMSMGDSCKISMLWNWYTIDSCFIASSWHITSHGMFAGSCIGVILLVMTLEFFRRFAKEYDRYILRAHLASLTSTAPSNPATAANKAPGVRSALISTSGRERSFRPSVGQQAVKAGLHMVQFAIAYFVMLLAMYFNGYIIICIFVGAFLGSFVFGWETVRAGGEGVEEEVTVCCG